MDFSGIWIPLVTPLRDGAVDTPAFRRLVQHLADQGVAGFVVCGSTGEAALLDDDEQDRVLRTTVEASSGLPVLFGLSGSRTPQLAGRARRLAQTGLPAGFLVSAPSYVRPSQAGIVDHFTTIADAAPLPVVAYDVPARTGVRIEVRTQGLAPLTRAVFAEPNPAPLKAALARQGWLAGELRLPLRPASEATATAVLLAERLSRQ